MLNTTITRRSGLAGGALRLSEAANQNSRLLLLRQPVRGRLSLAKRVVRLNPYLAAGLIAYEILSAAQEETWAPLGGWTKTLTTIAPNPFYYGGKVSVSRTTTYPAAALTRSFVTSGLGNQAYTGTPGDPWALVTSAHRTFVMGKTGDSFGVPLSRMQMQELWERPVAGAFTKPLPVPAKAPVALPVASPQTWPITWNASNAKPGEAPAFPAAIPFSILPRLNPAANPNRQVRYDVEGAPHFLSSMRDVPNDWSVSIGPRGAPNTAPGSHTMQPPSKAPPQLKERKVRMSQTAGSVLKMVSELTEAVDFIDALYKALPDSAKPRYRGTKYVRRVVSPHEKARALFDNFEDLDISDAIYNLIANEIEDQIYGRVGRVGGAISQRLGNPYGVGVNTIQRQFGKDFYDVERQMKNHVDGEQ